MTLSWVPDKETQRAPEKGSLVLSVLLTLQSNDLGVYSSPEGRALVPTMSVTYSVP